MGITIYEVNGQPYYNPSGIIKFYQLPEAWDDPEQYRYWWSGVTVDGVLIQKPKISEQEKQRYLVSEVKNIITTAGRTALLNYVGSQTSTNQPWGSWFALGNGLIVAVNPTDTSLSSEQIRKQPVTVTVTGTQVDLNIQLATTDIPNVSLTDAGLFGGATASGTSGSGTLYTHALIIPNFRKGSGIAYSVDYLINLL